MEHVQLKLLSGFTARETEVMALLFRGKKNADIAHILGLSINTVKSHLKHIYKKANVSSRTELIIRYIANQPPVE